MYVAFEVHQELPAFMTLQLADTVFALWLFEFVYFLLIKKNCRKQILLIVVYSHQNVFDFDKLNNNELLPIFLFFIIFEAKSESKAQINRYKGVQCAAES
jgi:hypothetical protein